MRWLWCDFQLRQSSHTLYNCWIPYTSSSGFHCIHGEQKSSCKKQNCSQCASEWIQSADEKRDNGGAIVDDPKYESYSMWNSHTADSIRWYRWTICTDRSMCASRQAPRYSGHLETSSINFGITLRTPRNAWKFQLRSSKLERSLTLYRWTYLLKLKSDPLRFFYTIKLISFGETALKLVKFRVSTAAQPPIPNLVLSQWTDPNRPSSMPTIPNKNYYFELCLLVCLQPHQCLSLTFSLLTLRHYLHMHSAACEWSAYGRTSLACSYHTVGLRIFWSVCSPYGARLTVLALRCSPS